ncbi:MAG: LysR family transcriptional regulator [Clostridia bacterium]|nr:LysR family transcriptional regulator [Clostridia bacterium]
MIDDLNLYTVFMAVAESGSISRAAERMYVSQPAVSASIARLEGALGTKVLLRTSRGVALTDEGSTLYNRLKDIFARIDNTEDILRDIAGLQGGTLRIGASDMTLRFFLLDYLQHFRDRYPKVHLSVTNAPTPQTLQALYRGDIDFGVISDPCDPGDRASLELIPVREIRDVFVCTDRYPLLGRKVSVRELADYPLILLERQTSTRRYVDEVLGGQMPSPAIELATSDLLLEFARRGIGITCIVEDFARADLEAGRLYKIDLLEEIPPRRFLLAYLKKGYLPSSARSLIGEINQTLSGEAPPTI